MGSNTEKEELLVEMKDLEMLVKSVIELKEVEVSVVRDQAKNKYVIKFACNEWRKSCGLHTQRKIGEPRLFSLDSAAKEIKKLGINQFTVIFSE